MSAGHISERQGMRAHGLLITRPYMSHLKAKIKRQPIVLFKRKSMKLCLYLKAKSLAEPNQHSCV